MLEHTKKRRTDSLVEVRFLGNKREISKLKRVAKEIGLHDASESVPWREAFPEYRDNIPGTLLRGSRHKDEITQKWLSELTGIPQRHISEMETGKRTIGREMAKKLSEIFHCDYRIFL